MIKLNINKLELPVFDIVQATPFSIPLKKDFNLYFEIPSVNEYFIFEAKYLKVIHDYLVLFSGVSFLELKDFKSLKVKEQFLEELKMAIQNEKFKKAFKKVIVEYFTANFEIKKIMDIANPFQLGYLIMFIHKIVENVKSFFFTGGGRSGSKDVGDFFYFFEKNFGKNRAEILAMPITYAMLMIEKHNQDQRDQAKDNKKKKPKGRINIKKFRKGKG